MSDANQNPVVVCLVGNKSDLPNRQVSQEQGEAVAAEIKALYRETSAVSGKGINEVFEDICEEYLKANPTASTGNKKTTVDINSNQGKGCSC